MSANDVTPAAPANVYAAPTDRSVRARERVEVALHLRVLAGDACAVCGGTGAEHVATPNLGKAALADLDDYLPRATLCIDCHEEHRAAGRGEFKRFVALACALPLATAAAIVFASINAYAIAIAAIAIAIVLLTRALRSYRRARNAALPLIAVGGSVFHARVQLRRPIDALVRHEGERSADDRGGLEVEDGAGWIVVASVAAIVLAGALSAVFGSAEILFDNPSVRNLEAAIDDEPYFEVPSGASFYPRTLRPGAHVLRVRRTSGSIEELPVTLSPGARYVLSVSGESCYLVTRIFTRAWHRWSDETIETTEMDTIRARWFEAHGLVSRTQCR